MLSTSKRFTFTHHLDGRFNFNYAFEQFLFQNIYIFLFGKNTISIGIKTRIGCKECKNPNYR